MSSPELFATFATSHDRSSAQETTSREKDSSSVRDPTSPRSSLQESHVWSPALVCPPSRTLERPPHQTRGGQFTKPSSQESSSVRDPTSPRSSGLQGSRVFSPGPPGSAGEQFDPSMTNSPLLVVSEGTVDRMTPRERFLLVGKRR